jgi:hypothetical protein
MRPPRTSLLGGLESHAPRALLPARVRRDLPAGTDACRRRAVRGHRHRPAGRDRRLCSGVKGCRVFAVSWPGSDPLRFRLWRWCTRALHPVLQKSRDDNLGLRQLPAPGQMADQGPRHRKGGSARLEQGLARRREPGSASARRWWKGSGADSRRRLCHRLRLGSHSSARSRGAPRWGTVIAGDNASNASAEAL